MKPILQWACRELHDGWVMIGVDVDLSTPEQPETLLGLRRAVHPFQFDELENPVMGFTAVISEMDKTIRRAAGMDAPDHSSSRACAFLDDPEVYAYQAGRASIRPKAISVDNMRELADASQRMHGRGA